MTLALLVPGVGMGGSPTGAGTGSVGLVGYGLCGGNPLVWDKGAADVSYLGDYTAGKTVLRKFNTHKADGTPVTLAGTPAVSVYKNSTTESTTGVSLTVDYDSRTGLHSVSVDTSADGTFYAAGNDFDIVITTGTVDSISVVGTVVGTFSLANRSALRPTTADRTLVVDAAGLADANVVKVGPSGSGTAQTARDIGASVLLSSGTGTGQVTLTSGRVNADVTHIATAAVSTSTAQLGVNVVNFGGSAGTFASGRPEVNATHIAGSSVSTSSAQIGVNVVNAGGTAWGSGAITAASIAADAITAAKIADGAIDAATFASGAITAASIAADAIGASELAADAVTEIAAGVWDLATSGHTTSGTFGAAMNAAGAAGDPWSTSLPGAYSSGTAGYIVGTNLDAAVSSRSTLTQTQVTGGAYPISDASFSFSSFLTAINANVQQWRGDVPASLSSGSVVVVVAAGGITSSSFAAGAIDAAAIAANAIGASELAADAVAEIQSGLSTLTASGVRDAVGLASADLDTQLGAINTAVQTMLGNDTIFDTKLNNIKVDTAAILDDTGTSGVVVASGSKTGYSLAAAGLDGITVESGLNGRQALSIIASSVAGVLAGAATSTVTIAAAGVSATNRITATCDSDGNRTAVSLSPPA